MGFKYLSNAVAMPLVIIVMLFLSGCTQLDASSVSQIPSSKPAVVKKSAWQQRQAFFTQRSIWELRSKVSLRFSEENVIFGFNWQQRSADTYIMQISNPITGALVSKLTRAKGTVSLLSDNGKTYTDSDEERLLKRQSGLSIPLKGMQYWVRGITSPQYSIESLTLDNAGRPLVIEQAGWKMTYTGYENNGTKALPRKININRGAENIFIRLVAKNWK